MSLDPNALFYVAATIKVVPEKLDEVLAGFEQLAGLVEANEPGALSYQVFYDEQNQEVAVFEIYKDAAAFEAHRNSDHFKAALERQSDGLFQGPPKIQVIQRKSGFRRG